MSPPARPPGLVPHVEPCEDRARLFDRQFADGAVCTAVDLLDDECTHGDVSESGVELDRGFHFVFSLFLMIDFAYREQSEIQTVESVQDAHQSGLVPDVPGKDHFSVIQ